MNDKKPPQMTLAELALQCTSDSERWFPGVTNRSIPHHTLALAGEVGEFANIVKKLDRGSLDISDAAVRYDLAMELTDCFVYLLQLAGMLRIDLYESYKVVRANNEKRFMDKNAPHRQGRAVRDSPQA